MGDALPNQVRAELTPSRLQRTILSLAAAQQPGNRAGVALGAIVEAVLQGDDLGQGAAGWAAYLQLKQAIAEAVSRIPGMRYVEGDA